MPVVIVGGPPAVRAAIEAAVRSPAAKKQIHEHMKKVADAGVEHWKGVHPPDSKTGQYHDSIKILEDKEDRIRIGSRDFKAHWIEYGTKHQRAFAPMAKTRSWLNNGGAESAASMPSASEAVEGLGGE